MIHSEVKAWHGLPTLFVNGEPINDPAYITYLPERNDYERFGRTGSHLYSVTFYFGRQPLNEVSQIHPMADGIFDVKGRPDFTVPDRELRRIVEADPEALIFPRVNTALPVWWEDENPDELNDEGVNGHRRRACFASDKWFDAVDEGLRLLAEHYEGSAYEDHIVGWQIAGGNTEEWFSFDQKGGIGLRAREKWAKEAKPDSAEADFYAFLSRTAADAIAGLARKMKRYIGGRLVVGSFYGYTFETPFRSANHAALMRLLDCEALDFLCSPMSYAEVRRPGIDHSCMTVLESIKRRGKLYFTEVDERTYRTKLLAECREDACEPGTYDGGVWFGPKDAWTSRQVLRADFARQLIHGCNFWWFDMWGGWYDEDMLADFKAERSILRRALNDEERGRPAEAAAYIDESYQTMSASAESGRAAYRSRIPMTASGVPYDCYDAADFEGTFEQYRAFVLIEPFETPAMNAVKARLDAENRPYLLIKNETELSPAFFREFFRANGLHVWCDTDDALHANARWAAVHAAEAGEKTLRLPGLCRVEPQFGEGEPFTADEIHVTMRQFETRLYRIEPI